MQIVHGDGGFDALAYGGTHPNVIRFIDEQAGRLSSSISDAGRGFMDYVGGLVDRVSRSEIGQRVQALASKAGTLFDTDTIRPLESICAFQHAKSQMRRWTMANPALREMYHKQRIEGYDGLYVDVEPDRIGADHYDYRRATDGFVQFDDNDDWYSTTYMDELKDGDRDLTLSEQVNISLSWEMAEYHLARKCGDPTSPQNAPL